jgi:hypothetical protein
MAGQMQIRRFCVRWYTIVIAADKDGAGAGNHFRRDHGHADHGGGG